MESAPIDVLRPAFEEAVGRGPVVVEAATGSGKSTRLPLWLREHGRTLVVEPRRLAARSLARYLAHSDGTQLGHSIGYAVRFDTCFSDTSEVVFATPGVVLRWLAQDGLAGFSHLFLDEFHERRWDTDLIAALADARQVHRLVIASATLDGAALADHFAAAHLVATGRSHPVETTYSDKPTVPSSEGLAERVAQAVTAHARADDSGDILVFLPGRGEIREAEQALAPRTKLPIRTLHAGTPAPRQDELLRPSDTPRVILATNVAETSLTLPSVRTVIDSGLERRRHPRNGRIVLALHPVSRAAADQRAGRAGRTAPGRCHRLWSRQGRLEAHTPPQIAREELDELVLAAAAVGLAARQLRFPDALPEVGLQQAELRLRNLGAIDAEGGITPHGRALFGLPLEPFFAHLIAAMPDRATRAAMVDLTAAMSAGPLFPMLPGKAAEVIEEWIPEGCDATALIRLVRDDPPAPLRFRPDAVGQARRMADRLRELLELPPRTNEPVPRESLCRALLEVAPETAYVRRARRRDTLGNGASEVAPSDESLFPDTAEAALVLDQHTVPGRGTNRTHSRATVMAPVPLEWLAEAGLGELSGEDATLQEGQILVTHRRRYAGRVIAEHVIEPEGALARQAIADLILGDRLHPGTGPSLQDDIDAWNLYVRLHDTGEPVDARDWLVSRLTELGVEHGREAALLEPEDLCFEGIPSWERPRFDTHFPRRLSLEELWLEVHYDVRRKRIELIKTAGRRKEPPRPSELPPWTGWRVRFRDGSRALDIR